jgi:hypothetical protein
MNNFYYELESDGAVVIYDGVNSEPFVKQPCWADGTAWSEGEAEAWAEQVILSITDPTSDLPGDSPDAPTKPRPEPEEEVEIVEPEALPE